MPFKSEAYNEDEPKEWVKPWKKPALNKKKAPKKVKAESSGDDDIIRLIAEFTQEDLF